MDGAQNNLTKADLLEMLKSDGKALEELYQHADRIRSRSVGDEIFVRGIIEFSNECPNDCLYCGLRVSNEKIRRYAMSPDEIVAAAQSFRGSAQTTVVLQSGEHSPFGDEMLGDIVKRIKDSTSLAVTLSVGNRSPEVYAYWKKCGMDRFLLRFETSDPELFARIHPDCTLAERLGCLKALRALDVQVGSGFMIGIPGESLSILAENILLCRELDLDMIGIGPFIPNPDTPLGGEQNAYQNDPEMFFKAIAALRIFNPDAHIPATTAFDTVFPGKGRNLALRRGANVFMPNCTPPEYRGDYQLYPGKPCVDESVEDCAACTLMRLKALGRPLGKDPGDSVRKRRSSK